MFKGMIKIGRWIFIGGAVLAAMGLFELAAMPHQTFIANPAVFGNFCGMLLRDGFIIWLIGFLGNKFLSKKALGNTNP